MKISTQVKQNNITEIYFTPKRAGKINFVNKKADMERKLESVHTEVKGLRTALAGAFDEMKDVLVTIESKIDENARKARNRSSGDKDNIIVAGGLGSNSVEMFNWRQRTWSPLQPMPKERDGATSFTYNNQVTIAGGTVQGLT